MSIELSAEYKATYPRQEHLSPHLDVSFLVTRDSVLAEVNHPVRIGIVGRESFKLHATHTPERLALMLEAPEILKPAIYEEITLLPPQDMYDPIS